MAQLVALPAAASGPADAFAAKEKATLDALMADPRRALTLSSEAERLAGAIPDRRAAAVALANAKRMRAEAHLGLNHLAAAEQPAREAAALAAMAAPGSKLAGDIERTLGAIAASQGDVQQALRRYQTAHRYFTAAGEARSQAMALLDIGQIYWDAGDYDRVLHYFGEAEELIEGQEPGLRLALFNGRGEALRAMRRFAEAERAYATALKAAVALKSPMLQARILTNLANAQVLGGRVDAAALSVRRGLALASAPDVAEWLPYLYGAAARVAERRGDVAAATSRLEQAFAGQDFARTAMPFRELHEVAAVVYERQGRQDLAFAHLRAFQRLDKEAQALIATNSTRLMAAQFDFANQNLRISQLKSGQLERDIRLERQRSQFRTWLFAGLAAAGGIIFTILLTLYLSIRRSRDRLATSNTALEEALAAKTEFLATTSHEIRTPLNGILGMTQVMLTNRTIAPDVMDQIKVVHGAGEAMRTLVDDILDVAKMEAGELEAQDDTVVLPSLLREAALMWDGHARAKGITLELDLTHAPAAIVTDGGRLRQIVGNLLSNAVKFTEAGGVTVRCGTDGEALVLCVADTGVGIPAEHLDRIFEPFHQVDGGMSRQFSGTGLGLAICRNLARALGGTIAVDSAAGAGSTFTLRLPLRLAEPPAAGVRPAALADVRLVMLEANQLAQGMLRGLLEPHVKRVGFVENAADAIVALSGADQLLIEARSLIGEDEAPVAGLARLVEAARIADVRCSILFAPSDELPLGDVAALGADQIIVKPIGGTQLLSSLHGLYDAAAPAAAPAVTARPLAAAG